MFLFMYYINDEGLEGQQRKKRAQTMRDASFGPLRRVLAHESPHSPTQANAGPRKPTAASDGQRRPTTANEGQRRSTKANAGQRRPTRVVAANAPTTRDILGAFFLSFSSHSLILSFYRLQTTQCEATGRRGDG